MHRATHLGNPATRFADPLKTPDDLRRTLQSEALREDVQLVLRMSGYTGGMDDFLRAAAQAPVQALSIPVGSVPPAMSTRRKGRPHLPRNVLWAGKAPIDAYEFSFLSGERRYRVVTPKACSNFWVEEQLPRPRHALDLSCDAPANSARPEIILDSSVEHVRRRGCAGVWREATTPRGRSPQGGATKPGARTDAKAGV